MSAKRVVTAQDLSINGRPAIAGGAALEGAAHAGGAAPLVLLSPGSAGGMRPSGFAKASAQPPYGAGAVPGSVSSSISSTASLLGMRPSAGAAGVPASRQRMDSAASMHASNHGEGGAYAGAKAAAAAAATAAGASLYMGLSVQVPSVGGGRGSQPSSEASTPSGTPGAMLPGQRPGSLGGVGPAAGGARYPGRSITPLRYTGASSGGLGGMSGGGGGIVSGYAARMGGAGAGGSAVSRSSPGPVLMRTPSADRALDMQHRAGAAGLLGGGGGGSRAAGERLHSASEAERGLGPHHSLSADLAVAGGGGAQVLSRGGYGVGGLLSPNGGGMGPSAPIPTTPKPAPPGHRPNAGVARTLAPNGQPRKIPLAMLPSYHAGLANRPVAVVGAALPGTPAGGAAVGGLAGRSAAAQLRAGLQSK